jgi:NADH-quinone oxidoreductase subunit N
MLVGVIVSTRLGVQATIFYLAVYVVMNLAAFAVVVARERETEYGDDIRSLYGLGAARPWLAWPMTIAMLALAGFPATAGFFGKFYLIGAAVDNDWGWLGVVIVLGSAVSLVYYLRVIAAVWMRSPSEAVVRPGRAVPVMAGGSPEADDDAPRSPAVHRPGAVAATDDAPDAPFGERRRQPEVIFAAVLCAAATVALGIYPDPLFDAARDAGAALADLL